MSVRRGNWLSWRYGITSEDYEAMLHEQGHRCKVCRKAFDMGLPKTRAVDHCHSTGIVRGILCSSCNRGLGFFYDDPEILRSAMEYLRNSAADPVASKKRARIVRAAKNQAALPLPTENATDSTR